MATLLRRLVSKNKRRFSNDEFDLDLSFIDCGSDFQGRLIAMGYPAEGVEALYRNNVKDVKRFLQQQVAERQAEYKVYNLALERPTYTSEKLGGSLAQFCFANHQVPTLAMMWSFCEDLDNFLSQNEHNFAAVHCKAGKGRTGVLVCAYLIYKNLARNAEEAMQIYAQQRCKDSVGLTVESQKRWVRYFEASTREGRVLQSQPLTLQSLTISGLPKNQLTSLVISVAVRCPTTGDIQQISEISGKATDVPTKASLDSDRLSIEFTPLPSGSTSSGAIHELKVDGDVRVEVYKHKVTPRRLVCRTWLSTGYLSPGPLTLQSHELDKGHSAVPEGLQLRANFGEAQRSSLSCTVSATCSELETLPIGSPYTSVGTATGSGLGPLRLSVDTSIPSRSASLPSQATTPHILDIHPDFSIPARYFSGTPTVVPPLDLGNCIPMRHPFLAAVQECAQTPQESERSFKVDDQELSARLEHLAELQSKVPGSGSQDSTPFQNADIPLDMQNPTDNRGSNWRPRGAAIKNAFSSNLKRVRWPTRWEDPEIQDQSAPTTPSRPRPPGSLDWQASQVVSLSPSLLDLRSNPSLQLNLGSQGSLSLLQNWDGLETPSHAAQMIKWMSSSWWLSMV